MPTFFTILSEESGWGIDKKFLEVGTIDEFHNKCWREDAIDVVCNTHIMWEDLPMVNLDGEVFGPSKVFEPEGDDEKSMVSRMTVDIPVKFVCMDCVNKEEQCKECKWRSRN